MAATVEVAGYWLPSEFFDDSVIDKNDAAVDPDVSFPTEFPYHLEYFSGEPKGRVMSTSPQSTLAHTWTSSTPSAGGSSPNGPATSPPSPAEHSVGNLVHLAAGRVAKLKLHDAGTPRPAKSPGLNRNIHKKQGGGVLGGGPQQWPVQRNPARTGMSGPRAVPVSGSGGSAVKRGTGVFIPRRFYGDIRNDQNINSCSSGYIPQRNGFAPSQPLQFNPGFVTEYDLLMARRNALILQHRQSILLEGSSRVGRRVCLPREWSY